MGFRAWWRRQSREGGLHYGCSEGWGALDAWNAGLERAAMVVEASLASGKTELAKKIRALSE